MFKIKTMHNNDYNEYNKNTIVLTTKMDFNTIVTPKRNLLRSTHK